MLQYAHCFCTFLIGISISVACYVCDYSFFPLLQGDYVLCRLFHKADERLDNSKCIEVEHTGSVPSTDKSSPDDVSSDVFREPAMLDMQMVKEPEDVKKGWKDQTDCLIPTILAPPESFASDGIDHSEEETAMEVTDEIF